MNFFRKILKNIIKNKNEKDLKRINNYINSIHLISKEVSMLSNDDLRNKTYEFKDNIKNLNKDLNKKLDSFILNLSLTKNINSKKSIYNDIFNIKKEIYNNEQNFLLKILPIAFAIVKETAIRFTNFKKILVKPNSLDLKLIKLKKPYIIKYNDKILWKNCWNALGKNISWNMIHYDVQLIGGVVLHEGKIAEMATGEGKTLVATLPIYLNALTGRGVHVVTVNDYLSKRDASWMGPIMEFLGLSVDCIDLYPPNTIYRKNAYKADITYGTNNEFGFDYLRDNISSSKEDIVQRELNYAIVDEVDSVLIDEARTPLIISGPMDNDIKDFIILQPEVEMIIKKQKNEITKILKESRELIDKGDKVKSGFKILQLYRGLPKYKPIIKFLSEDNIRILLKNTEHEYMQDNQSRMNEIDKDLYFIIDEKNNTVTLTDKGIRFLSNRTNDSNFFVLPDINYDIDKLNKKNISNDIKINLKEEIFKNFSIKSKRLHTINQLLKAYTLFEKDIDYIVLDKKVKIVDEQTGRIMEGRRYSDGLHQALESKENLKIESSTQTLATITLQNYFRMYNKLSGMTGTAETESEEFWQIYKLDVIVIPTNKSVIRIDYNDLVFKTIQEKYNAIIDKIIQLSTIDKRPVLVGTTSVIVSEIISRMLKIRKITHNVLNAKLHKKEADIIGEAGLTSVITIATNMAGRGTDIKISEKVKKSGGLAIIGTERHDSRRVDRQLRGRSGRQGDPGSSQFYVSLEDTLMRLFIGSDRLSKLMDHFGHKEGDVIQHSLVSRSIERAQKKVEENNFGIRKRLLEYDDVMNKQRKVIYEKRKNALLNLNNNLEILTTFYNVLEDLIYSKKHDNNEINNYIYKYFKLQLDFSKYLKLKIDSTNTISKIYNKVINNYKLRNEYLYTKIFPFLNKVKYIDIYNKIGKIKISLYYKNINIEIPFNIEKINNFNIELFIKYLETYTIINIMDNNWKIHLKEMEDLRYSVQNVIYEQKDPLIVYKKEAFNIFYKNIKKINQEIVLFLFNSDIYSDINDFTKKNYLNNKNNIIYALNNKKIKNYNNNI